MFLFGRSIFHVNCLLVFIIAELYAHTEANSVEIWDESQIENNDLNK